MPLKGSIHTLTCSRPLKTAALFLPMCAGNFTDANQCAPHVTRAVSQNLFQDWKCTFSWWEALCPQFGSTTLK